MMAFVTGFQRARFGFTHFMAFMSSEAPLKTHNRQCDQLSSTWAWQHPWEWRKIKRGRETEPKSDLREFKIVAFREFRGFTVISVPT